MSAFVSTEDKFACKLPADIPINVTDASKNTPHFDAHSGPLGEVPTEFFQAPSVVFTPVKVNILSFLLRDHPDKVLVDFLVAGFTHGFRLGFHGRELSSSKRNNSSAYEHAGLIDEAILKELNRGHTVGPFVQPPLTDFHCSPLGAAPKKDGTVRVILDLSSPHGESVNDGIFKEDYSVKYSLFDEAVDLVRSMGKGAFMVKLDVKHAFRICPVHPCDWHLLGYKWRDRFFYDIVLAFGGRSSPFIFNNFADILNWIVSVFFEIPNLLHYLDDFFSVKINKFVSKSILDFIIKV